MRPVITIVNYSRADLRVERRGDGISIIADDSGAVRAAKDVHADIGDVVAGPDPELPVREQGEADE